MDIDFNIPTIITKRNVDSGGNPISVKLIEIRQIMDNYSCVVLSQTPDEYNRIYIEGFTEVFDIEKLDKKNFKVDYSQGIIYFHPFNIGKAISIEYYGTGYELISASRIFTKVDKYGNVIDTLEEILNRASLQLKLIESLDGAIKVIEKLDEDIKNANNLNAYFDEMIPEATGLKNELDTIVTDAKGWKDQLKQDVKDGKELQPLLHNDVMQGREVKQQLDQSIADAQDDIAKIEATGNEIIYITSSQWVYNDTSKMYEKQVTHPCNSENIHVSCKATDTKDALFLPWKPIDKSNILLKSDEAIGVSVIISASYYKALIDNTTTQEVIDARKGEASLLDKMNSIDMQLENNTIEINNLKNKNVQGYKITDPLINSYSQELTLTNGFNHYNSNLYGKLYLNVEGGLFTVNGVVDKNTENPRDFSLTTPIAEMKQKTSKLFNGVAYDSTWTKSNNNAIFLNNDGGLGVDSSIFNLDSSCNKYMNININGQIVKDYVSTDNQSMVTHLINRAKSKINRNSSIVVHGCDTHIRPLEDESTSTLNSYNIYAPKVLNYINKNIGAFATICNGDTMTESNSVKTKDLLKLQGTKIRRMYNENTVFVLGNHDDGSLLEDSEFLTKEEFNEIFNFGKLGIVNSYGLQPYFYSDDIIGRCRHIFLNTHDGEGRKIGLFNIGVNQIKWLIDILNNTGSMSICIWCHAPLCDNVTNKVQNVEIIRNILSAYKQRNKIAISLNGETINVDFSKSTGLIAGVISGHEHCDYQQVIDGINYIIDKDFYTGLSASVYIIDHTFRKLNVLRMGENRKDLMLNY